MNQALEDVHGVIAGTEDDLLRQCQLSGQMSARQVVEHGVPPPTPAPTQRPITPEDIERAVGGTPAANEPAPPKSYLFTQDELDKLLADTRAAERATVLREVGRA